MNIMELEVGETGVTPDGTRFRILRDERERRPALGLVTVRIAQDQNGRIQKFIRGIEVERVGLSEQNAPTPTKGDGSFMEPGEMSQGFARRARDPWG